MVHQVALRVKALSTGIIGASEWSLVFVNTLVHFQVLSLAERFATAFETTLERLCSIVHVHVCLKTTLAATDTTAASHRTRIHLPLLCLSLDRSKDSKLYCMMFLGDNFGAG